MEKQGVCNMKFKINTSKNKKESTNVALMVTQISTNHVNFNGDNYINVFIGENKKGVEVIKLDQNVALIVTHQLDKLDPQVYVINKLVKYLNVSGEII